MQKKRKYILLALTMVLLLGLMPITVAASEEVTLDEFVQQTAKLKRQHGTGTVSLYEDDDDEEGIRYTNRVIVKSDSTLTDKTAIGVAGPYKNIYVFQYWSRDEALEACERFSTMPEVEYAQVSQLYSSFGLEYTDINTWGQEQVGFSMIDDIVSEKYGNNVEDIVVAVIDSGLDFDHPLFKGRLAGKGTDVVNGDADATDDYMHGTAVSGIIVSSTPDYVKVLPVKSADNTGLLEEFDIYNGIQYAIDQNVDIINMSYGGYGYSKLNHEALQEAEAAGILLVAAYGNDSKNTAEIYPAVLEGVIGVSAVNVDQQLASFSNYGGGVDVSAPGEGIYTAYPTNMGDGSGYVTENGTSFASPFTAAALAMLKAANPDCTAEQLKNLLYSNAVDLGEPGWDKEYGYGMISFDNYSEVFYQAYIGSARYKTLADACAAAKNDDTIGLLADVQLNGTISVQKKISISANGQTISRASGFTGAMFQVKQNGKLTLLAGEGLVNGLTVDGHSTDTTASAIKVDQGGTLILGDGVQLVNNHASGSGGAIYNAGELYLYAVSISGNTADKKGNGICNTTNSSMVILGQMEATEDDTVYLGDGVSLSVKGEMKPNGLLAVLELKNYTSGTVVVEYASDCSPSRKHFQLLNSNYTLKLGTNSLIVQPAVAHTVRIGTTTYPTLEAALSASSNGDEIVLLKDVTITTTIRITGSCTLSAEGECWINRDPSLTEDMIVVAGGGTLTLGSKTNGSRELCFDGGDTPLAASAVKVENDGKLNLNHVYITGSHSTTQGHSAVSIAQGGTAVVNGAVIIGNIADAMGGGVYNEGTLTIKSGSITENTSNMYAGGIANFGKLVMNGGSVENNEAQYMGGGIANWEEFTFNGGKVSDNRCVSESMFFSPDGEEGAGGGIWNSGILTINGGIVSGNSSPIKGGGIFNSDKEDSGDLKSTIRYEDGIIYLNGGEISGNSADWKSDNGSVGLSNGYGGGVFNRGIIYMDGGTISQNHAVLSAGGLYNCGEFYMTGGFLGENTIITGWHSTRGYESVELYAGFLSAETSVLTSLTGGTIFSPNTDPSVNSITIDGAASRLLMGGDLVVEDDLSVCLFDSKLEITEVFTNDNPSIGLFPYSHSQDEEYVVAYPAPGLVLVSYAAGLTPDLKQFHDVTAYALEVKNQNIVLTNEGKNVTASGVLYHDEWSHVIWDLKDHVLTISGLGNIHVPYLGGSNSDRSDAFYADVPWASCKASVEEVRIEAGIGSIFAYLFSEMHNLKQVTIPYTVNSIGSYTFSRCTSLEMIHFDGDFPVYLEEYAFSRCSEITVAYPKGNDTWKAAFDSTFGARNIIWKPYEQSDAEQKAVIGIMSIEKVSGSDGITINYRGFGDFEGWFCYASFDADGRMISVEMKRCSFTGEILEVISYPIPSNADEVRVLILDDSFAPQCESKSTSLR